MYEHTVLTNFLHNTLAVFVGQGMGAIWNSDSEILPDPSTSARVKALLASSSSSSSSPSSPPAMIFLYSSSTGRTWRQKSRLDDSYRQAVTLNSQQGPMDIPVE